MDKDSLIYITGGAGFIGSNLVRHLNAAGYYNITVVDDLTDVRKFKNLRGLKFGYFDKDEFRKTLTDIFINEISRPQFVFHLGGISSTTHKNGKELMDQNYQFSVDLIAACTQFDIPIHYASSASVYGNEEGGKENPLNGYAFSKWCIDEFVRDLLAEGGLSSQVIGLRYFNVYGPNEEHKDGQASVIYNWYLQLMNTGKLNLFKTNASRDFIHVDDICKLHLWLMENNISGLIDVGTGKSTLFSKVAQIVADWYRNKHQLPLDLYETNNSYRDRDQFGTISLSSLINEIPMPSELCDQYQLYTKASHTLAEINYNQPMLSVKDGVLQYLEELDRRRSKVLR